MSTPTKKILIIRFSSIGDIVQTCFAAIRLKFYDWKSGAPFVENANEVEIHWLTRADMADLVSGQPFVNKVWSLERKKGLPGLLQLARELSRENFTHVYDAHNNLRSRILTLFLKSDHALNLVRRSHLRFQILLTSLVKIFNFDLSKSFLNGSVLGYHTRASDFVLLPLKKWEVENLPSKIGHYYSVDQIAENEAHIFIEKNFNSKKYIVLCPSAAHMIKVWPVQHWQELVQTLSDCNFLILSGPKDIWVKEIKGVRPGQVVHPTTPFSFPQCAALIKNALCTIGNDSGMMHIADQLGVPAICFLGPTFFGRPTSRNIKIFETDLSCRPCTSYGKVKCRNEVYQKCLKDISPRSVISYINENFCGKLKSHE